MTADNGLVARLPIQPEIWANIAHLLLEHHGYAGTAPLHVWWKLIPYAGKEISYDSMAGIVAQALVTYIQRHLPDSIEDLMVGNWIGTIFGQLVTIHHANHVLFKEALARALAAEKI